LDRAFVHHAIDNRGEGFSLDIAIDVVRRILPKFNLEAARADGPSKGCDPFDLPGGCASLATDRYPVARRNA
ncbi:MAG: hypothetical protein ACTHU0_09680, partial [Kofleriaceae bacterium]